MRNDEEKAVQLSRNCRIKRITEINFSNAFQINSEVHDLIIKSSKISQHKFS